MCGVVGALGAGEEFEARLVHATDALMHRGIRHKLSFNSAGGVGHVRLPIVGLDGAHDQPMINHGWTVGFVGELLDFREHRPGMECDAELVLEHWVHTGPGSFTQHDGFWGIAAIHDQTQTLHVLTDYLGQKPMYWRADAPSAASEIDALLPFGPVTLDEVYLSACLKWGYCPDVSRTPYNEIKHAFPGEWIVLNKDGVYSRQIVDELEPIKADAAGLRGAIELAVERRVLSSDVPVACLLSGGLDSSIVYELARRYAQIIPYFAEDETNEADYRRALFSVQQRPLHKIKYDTVSVDEALGIMQEPIDLGSLRPQIALAKAIPHNVCLTGDGADELFGGYSRSLRYDSQYSDVFMELPAWHLPRLDRAMMHNQVEVRSPFLARNVVRMALALPHELRQDKFQLRQMFPDILSPSIICAPKKALRTPEIERDREGYSKTLVDRFREKFDAR